VLLFYSLASFVVEVGRPGRLLGRWLAPFMKTWWLVLINRSSSDSATTGLGNSGYQSTGDRFEVITRLFPAAARAVTSS
jgi:hypothetical protein